jgi:hypothetical protein
MCKSALKLSCNAPGLSKQKYDPEMRNMRRLKLLPQQYNEKKDGRNFIQRST